METGGRQRPKSPQCHATRRCRRDNAGELLRIGRRSSRSAAGASCAVGNRCHGDTGSSLRGRRLTACPDDSFENVTCPCGACRHVAFQKPGKRFPCEPTLVEEVQPPTPVRNATASIWPARSAITRRISAARRELKYRPAGVLPKTS